MQSSLVKAKRLPMLEVVLTLNLYHHNTEIRSLLLFSCCQVSYISLKSHQLQGQLHQADAASWGDTQFFKQSGQSIASY